MQLARKSWAGLCLVVAMTCAVAGFAQETTDPKSEDDTLAVKLGFYNQRDGKNNFGGNHFIDENESVFESIILLDKAITPQDNINFRFLTDIISSASISRYHNPQFRALQSGASGNKNFVGTLGWQHKWENTTLGLNISGGKEYAYKSLGYGVTLSQDLFEKNTNVSLRFQGYNDAIKTILFNGFEAQATSRDTYSGEVAINQILTPRSIVNVAYNHTEQHGMLATSYNSVFAAGVEGQEIVPYRRHRDSITGRYKFSFTESNALELGYRYYWDSWHIYSNTAEVRFFQYLMNKKLLLEPNYRYYLQDRAFFYQQSFAAFSALQTSDPDLGDFYGNLFGLDLSILDPHFFTWWRGDLDFGFNYNLRSDDLNGYWFTAGYTLRF